MFIVNDNGLFLVMVLINVNLFSRILKYLFVVIKDFLLGLIGNNGLLVGKIFLFSWGLLIVSGIVWFDKGDVVIVYVYINLNDSDVVDGLFCVSVIFYDWLGVIVILMESIFFNMLEWMRVIIWKMYGVFGLFFFDNVFFLVSGIYYLC